jgi:multidrug efflux pump subunit AcrA (membrane-fusion protein)
VKNLRIETVEVEETDFEATIFSLGRIEAIPSKVAAVSSRIPGRIIELKLTPGDTVKAGRRSGESGESPARRSATGDLAQGTAQRTRHPCGCTAWRSH